MMKIFFVILAVAAAAPGCATGPGKPPMETALAADTLDGASEVVVAAQGLSCPLCASNLDAQLNRIEGVDGASVDLATGEATVRLDKKHAVTALQLRKAVEDAGFTFHGVRPARPPE